MQVQATDHCSHDDNPCLEGGVKVTDLMFVHEYGTETNHYGCSCWQWGRFELLNESTGAGIGEHNVN